MPSFKFFLPHAKLHDEFIANYDINTAPAKAEYKGIVIECTLITDPATQSYKMQATISGVKGSPDEKGELAVIANTTQILCPHPPPCQ